MRTITFEISDKQLQELREHMIAWDSEDINYDKLSNDMLFFIYKNYLEYQNKFAKDIWSDPHDPIHNDIYEDEELNNFLIEWGVLK